MRALFASLSKDTKLIVRNWHTILSFMILPFILIIVIGFIFGSESDASIIVGFEDVDRSIIPDMDEIIAIDVDSCEDRFSEESLNACIARDGGRIEVFIDNSRTNLYAYTISLLQQAIERENEQAAIGSINALRTDLERQLTAVSKATDQLSGVEESIEEANASIEELETAFEQTGRSLGEERIALQETRAELESLNRDFDERATLIDAQLDDLESDLRELDQNLSFARAQVQEEYRGQIDELRGEISDSLELIDNLRFTVGTVESSQNVVLSQVIESSERLDELLDSFDAYSDRISEQRELVYALGLTAQELGVELGSVQNGTSEALSFSPSEILRSVNARYTLFYDNDTRLLILPMVTMMILVFLSTVIASLLVHEELSSPAMVRIELSAASRWVIDLSKIIVITGIVMINVILMYVIALTLWNANFAARLPLLIGIGLPAIVVFSLFGAALAYLIRRPFVLFVSATFVSMMFIIGSGILRPIELLDPMRTAVVAANPATIFLESTRITLLGTGSGPILGLFVWVGVGLVFLTFARSIWHRTVFRD